MVVSHRRDTLSMQNSPRCGAKTRAGTPCQSPAVAGKKRCRMHGGARGSGAPPGNQNAFKHGMYTQEEKNFNRYLKALAKAGKEAIEDM